MYSTVRDSIRVSSIHDQEKEDRRPSSQRNERTANKPTVARICRFWEGGETVYTHTNTRAETGIMSLNRQTSEAGIRPF